MKKKKKKLIGFVVVAVLIVALGIWMYLKLQNSSNDSGMIETAAQVMDLRSTVKCTGNIEAVNQKSVYTQIDGTIMEVKVKKGDMVKKGDVIATFDTSDVEFNIKVKEAEAQKAALESEYALKDSQTAVNQRKEQLESGLNTSVDSAQNRILTAQQSYMDAADAYNLAKEQYDTNQTPGIVSAQQALNTAQATYNAEYQKWSELPDDVKESMAAEFHVQEVALQNAKQSLEKAKEEAKLEVDKKYNAMLEAENALRDAERDYDASVLGVNQDMEVQMNNLEKNLALATKDAAELELGRLKASLDKYVLYAIEDGCITELKLVAGENIAKNTLAATITNFEKMKVAIKIDEYDVGEVSVGDKAEIYISSIGKTYTGTITDIARTATVKDNIAYVEAVVEFDADENTRSGLSAEVTAVKSERKGVVVVPAGAVQYDEDHSAYVMTKEASGEVIRQYVEVGISDGAWTEITEGIHEGDIVLEIPAQSEMAEMAI